MRRTTRSISGILAGGLLSLLITVPALAIPTQVTHTDLASCDPLLVPTNVHELGNLQPPFPQQELIAAGDAPTSLVACPASDDAQQPNVEVTIQNLTGTSFLELWYVADPETAISNVDGLVNNEPAFRIDYGVANSPLVFESILADGIFQPNELWTFVIDDYFNALGLPASSLGSAGVGFLSGGLVSSGSIIAIIPEPSTLWLLTLGVAGLATRRRVLR